MKKIYLIIYMLLSNLQIFGSSQNVDVVICCHEKDIRTLDMCINGIRKYGQNVRRIIVVSNKKFTDNAEWFNEKLFPFSKYDVSLAIFNDPKKAADFAKGKRIGWIYKQLLNWYALFVIPGISPNMLILDADTIFLNKVRFLDSQNRILYTVGSEYHKPYFEHAKKLISGKDQIVRVHPKFSGIAHQILFQKDIVKNLFKRIYQTHKIEPWKAMCKCIDHNHAHYSSLAEGEIYFNFAIKKPNRVIIRKLKWTNIRFDKQEIKNKKLEGYHYVSCHTYLESKKIKDVKN